MYLLLFLLATSAFATPTYMLEDITVSTQKPSGEISTFDEKISTEQISELNASNLDDLLRVSASSTTTGGPRGSAESIQIRGLEQNKIFTYVDGVRQNFTTNHSSMLAIDVDNLKSVGIITTASDSSKSGSIGGGTILNTKDVDDYLKPNKKDGAQFKTQYNGANSEKLISAKSYFRQKKLKGLLSITQRSAKDLQLNNGETLQDSSFEDVAILSKLYYKKTKITYDYFKKEDESPLNPTLDVPQDKASLLGTSKTSRHTLSVGNKFRNNILARAYVNHQQLAKERKNDSFKEERLIETYGLDLSQKNKIDHLGIEIYRDKVASDSDSGALSSYPNASSINAGVYYQTKIKYKKLEATPGVRFNFYQLASDNNELKSRSGSALSKKIGFEYRLSSSTKISSNIAEGYNAPKLLEIYPNGLHYKGDSFFISDNYFIPNLELKHEQSLNYDISIDFENSILTKDDLLKLRLSKYYNEVDDYIAFEQIDRAIFDGKNGTTQFINIPEAFLRGSEVSLAYLYDIWDVAITYSKIRGYNKTQNLYLAQLPADNYQYSIKLYLDRLNLTLGYLGHQVNQQHRVNEYTLERTDKTDSYFIHNIFAKKSFSKSYEVNFRIDNVGNKKYRKHGSNVFESKQDYKLSFKYKINTI
ncbi:TonB-dependent receptor [Bacteriovoracaceae bacterium]|nr:TonB-dependent receptor [Bacteriovoracaceae bacterium]